MYKNPVYVSKKGGTIISYKGDNCFLFRVSSKYQSLYCHDIRSAREHLRLLEQDQIISNKQTLPIPIKIKINYRNALKKLVETAAAPYLEEDFSD